MLLYVKLLGASSIQVTVVWLSMFSPDFWLLSESYKDNSRFCYYRISSTPLCCFSFSSKYSPQYTITVVAIFHNVSMSISQGFCCQYSHCGLVGYDTLSDGCIPGISHVLCLGLISTTAQNGEVFIYSNV